MNEVLKDIYQVEIPLKGNPLRAIYSYIIKGQDANGNPMCFIIDTGFNAPACRQALEEALDALQVDLKMSKLIITHLHSDHSGLAAALSLGGVEVMTGNVDGQMINDMSTEAYWDGFKQRARMLDLEKDGVVFTDHPGYKYCPKKPIDYTPLSEGDTLEIGGYTFTVIDVPGHTPGHIALYEKTHKFLISGDHILDPITPNIAFWGFEWNILEVYLKSLDKVRAMDVEKILPAHRKIITNPVERIDALKAHHVERLEEVQALIGDYTSVRDVAAAMKWSLRQKDWTDFPDPQKWFASGEAMSHLEYLFITKRADRIEKDGILLYKSLE
jgi:glyoxylase-like metal-dependent hydrolase (beta-lactamase superfamily II)